MTRRFLFRELQYQSVGEGATPFAGLLHFNLDPYLIMLSVKYHIYIISTIYIYKYIYIISTIYIYKYIY